MTNNETKDSDSTNKVLIFGLLVGALYLGLRDWGGDDEILIQGATVKRGDVEITVVERGNLSAKNAASIRSEIEGRATILSMVQEGTFVEAGDIVCELDTTDEVNRVVEQEISVQTAEAAFTKARENLEIQKLNNESEIAQAVTQVTLTEIDLTKFREAEKKQQQEKADESIKVAEGELEQAREQYRWSKELADKGFLTATELESDKLSFERSEISLDQATRAKVLLVQYEHPKQEVQLEEDLKEARREVERVKKEANAEIVDYQVELQTRETQLALERQQFDKLKDQIEKGILYAPSSGMVVYGREEGSRYGRGDPMQVGAEVRERQEILSIPSPGAMVAEMTLHESVLSQVTKGLPCRVSVDAVPGLEFRGSINFVSPLPDKNAWFANPNLRVFKTEVALDEPAEDDGAMKASLRELRPGMSCSVEVFVEHVADTLYVPLQCVFFKGGKNICFLKDGSSYVEREVETGPHNTLIVVISSGLEEGEVVFMSAPLGALEAMGAEGSNESAASRFGAAANNGAPKGESNASADGKTSEGTPGAEDSSGKPANVDHSGGGAGGPAGAGSGGRPAGAGGGGRPAGAGAGGRSKGAGGRSGHTGGSGG
jgi:HlyD family secretion protein